jgi:hypothetical protein
MTQTGRQIRRRFGSRGVLTAVAVFAAAVITGVIALIA